jgi:flagellar hook-associated protein 3 FlgL
VRVTNEMMVANSLRRLSTRLGRYERAQSQMATGRRLLAPSDDPAGTGRTLSLRASRRSREQEARNAADARSRLDIADTNLAQAVDRLHRVNDLTVRGASSLSAQERSAIATEVGQIREELRGIANARHRGVPLFAGYADPGDVVAPDGSYQGDAGRIERRIGEGEAVRVNVTAAEAFGLDAPGTNLFTLLDDIVGALGTGDTAAMAAALGRLDAARTQIGRAQAVVGTATNRVESAQRRGKDTLLTLRAELAEVEDVDLAEAALELQTQEVAYQATLQAMARALPPSLVSFLR